MPSPRFIDSWVLNNTMFLYLQGGGACICCVPQPFNLFTPEKEPIDALIRSLSDLNKDEMESEIQAVKESPWDEDMRGQVWGDRGLLRYRMKKEMSGFRRFMEEVSDGDEINVQVCVTKLHDFCKNNMTPKELHELFQLSREELLDILKTRYKICSFYTVVFCTVAEQLMNFELTGFGPDAPSCDETESNNLNRAELEFERDFKYDKKGRGFCIDAANMTKSTDCKDDFTMNDQVLLHFIQRMVSLAGPTLLTCSNPSGKKNNSKGPCFKADRRVIRLLIARYWAEKLIERYKEFSNRTE